MSCENKVNVTISPIFRNMHVKEFKEFHIYHPLSMQLFLQSPLPARHHSSVQCMLPWKMLKSKSYFTNVKICEQSY